MVSLMPTMQADAREPRRPYAVKTRTRPPQAQFDEPLIWVLIALLALGLVMVYSSSIATAEGSKFTGYQPSYYLLRHGIFVVVGIAAGVTAFQVPVETWKSYAPMLFVSGIVLLCLVLVPGIGKSVNGSQRWLSLFVVNLQPSELMKLFAVLYAASYTVRKLKVKDTFVKAFVPMFAVMVLVGGLLLFEPDMGAFVVILTIAICMLWLGGFNGKGFAALLVALPLAFAALIYFSPHPRLHAGQPQLFRDHRHQEIGMRLRQVEQFFHAAAQTHAEPFAAPEGDQRMAQLITLAVRVGPRVHETNDALHAIG